MKRPGFFIGMATAVLFGSLLVGPAWAAGNNQGRGPGDGPGRNAPPAAAQQMQPFGQIKHNLERQFGGRVLDVRRESHGQDESYNVKLLTRDGDVLMVETDARTGRIIGVKGGR